jgi:HEAT repeat protein
MEEKVTLDSLLAGIKSDDPDVRTTAWLSAGTVGATAIGPLAGLLTDDDIEVGRAAKRAMWKIVRTVGAPGVTGEKKAVVRELLGLLGHGQPLAVRREVIWMLSEIGGDKTIGVLRKMPEILDDKDFREDARCAVERIPGDASLRALEDALEKAPEDYKINIAQSLRVRGVEVPGLPCQKLVPTKETNVKPVGR